MSRTITWSLACFLPLISIAPVSAQPRNQLQNSSMEQDWLLGSILSERRFNILQRIDLGYGEADGVVDHWSTSTDKWDSSTSHSGRRSLKLSGDKISQSVRYAMKQPANTNPTGTQSDFEPFDAATLAKLEPRIVRASVWVKAQGATEGGTLSITSGGSSHSTPIPAGTYDWRQIEVVSPSPWPAAPSLTFTLNASRGTLWVDDASLAEEPVGRNRVANGDLEKLDAKGWPDGFSEAVPFWWYRYDYYGWTGWSHDGGYGSALSKRVDLIPGYRWRGHAAIDKQVRHSGHNSLRMVAYPGDCLGVMGPAVELDGTKPFEVGAWVKADQIYNVELMAIDEATGSYIAWDTDNFAGVDGQGVTAGSKGQGTYDWTYLRKLIVPKEPAKKVRPMLAVRGFDGLIVEKNIVGSVWFDDLEVIERGESGATAASTAPAADSVRILDFNLGDRMWGRNTARLLLTSDKGGIAKVELTITSPSGEAQKIAKSVSLQANKPAEVSLPYTITELCKGFAEQYRVELKVDAGGATETLATAFGTPSNLLAARVSHQYVLPGEKPVVGINLQISNESLAEVARVEVQVVDGADKIISRQSFDSPASKLPVLVPEANQLKYLNRDHLITLVPDISKCQEHKWQEAVRDYVMRAVLFDKSGKVLAQADGTRFGRITAFEPSPIYMEKAQKNKPIDNKVVVNDQRLLLVDGKPFFPVYFGEFGDTFRATEGVNISRDQIASLGVNPAHLSPEDKRKFGMSGNFAQGEWDFAFGDMTPEKIQAATKALQAVNPGKLISSGYDMVSHFGTVDARVASYILPAFDIACMEASFASHVPNLRVDWLPAAGDKKSAILVGFENYYFVPFEELRYRSYLTVMRGAAGLGLIPSRMMEARPESNTYLRGLNAEFRSLAPALVSGAPKTPVVCDRPEVFTWEKQLGDKRYLFVVRGEPTITRGLFNWDEKKKSPSGTITHTEPRTAALAQHLVQNTKPVLIAKGDVITQEVFIDGAAPKMIAMQIRSRSPIDHTWEHRGIWGTADLARFVADASYPADQKPPKPWHAWMVVENPRQPINAAIERGAGYYEVLGGKACKAKPGTPSLKTLGEVPKSGTWVTLRIPASEIGLEGKWIDGFCFSVDGGEAHWGKTSLTNTAAKETPLIEGSVDSITLPTEPWPVQFTVPGVTALQARALFEPITPRVEGATLHDTLPAPYRARVYELSVNTK